MSDTPNEKVSLGCGTLILIALIVLIFGNRGSEKDIEERLERIEKQLDRIETLLEKK